MLFKLGDFANPNKSPRLNSNILLLLFYEKVKLTYTIVIGRRIECSNKTFLLWISMLVGGALLTLLQRKAIRKSCMIILVNMWMRRNISQSQIIFMLQMALKLDATESYS